MRRGPRERIARGGAAAGTKLARNGFVRPGVVHRSDAGAGDRPHDPRRGTTPMAAIGYVTRQDDGSWEAEFTTLEQACQHRDHQIARMTPGARPAAASSPCVASRSARRADAPVASPALLAEPGCTSAHALRNLKAVAGQDDDSGRHVDDAGIGERVLQAQSRASLLRWCLVASLAFGAGGVRHRMAFVEHDDAIEIRSQPLDDLLNQRTLCPRVHPIGV